MSQVAALEPTFPAELSLAEWFDLPEDEPGELVDGQMVEEEVPNYIHEILVILLGSILRAWISSRGGFVAASDAKFAVGPKSGRKPDLTVYLPGTPLPPTSGVIREAPDIAIEILSPQPRDGRRDRVEKVAEYAAFGISYYWLVDPQLRSLEVLELASHGRYERVLKATSGTVERVPGCEGLSLDLDAVWAEIERFASHRR